MWHFPKSWSDLLFTGFELTDFVAGEVLQLDCSSLDGLIYIFAPYSQTAMSRPKSERDIG